MVSAFNSAWYNSQECYYDLGVQTDFLLPMSLGIVPNNNCSQLFVSNLLNDIVSVQNTHLTTGFSRHFCSNFRNSWNEIFTSSFV